MVNSVSVFRLVSTPILSVLLNQQQMEGNVHE